MGNREVLGEPAALSGTSHLHKHLSYSPPHMLHHPNTSFIRSQEESGFDFGELEEAIVLPGVEINNNETKQTSYSSVKPAATLEMFPVWPMRFRQRESSKSGGEDSTDSGSALIKPESESLVSTRVSSDHHPMATAAEAPGDSDHKHNHLEPPQPPLQQSYIEMESGRGSPSPRTGVVSHSRSATKQTTEKSLRRLAQNREAARKSRLRKKAYVQQLESSRIRLTQIEQEIQRARSQGFYVGGNALGDQGLPVGISNINSDAAVFDLEYSRWQEEHHRLMVELRNAVHEHLPENELRVFVDNCLAHYDQVMNLKSMIVKSDVFHLVSGMWKTPAERCFMWMAGFRPSEVIKIILNQIEPLTEQQLLGICGLQQSTREAEEALSQGLEALNQSISETMASDSLSIPPNVNTYMGQMASAMNKLSTLEGFVRQADNLRHQTLHRLHQILTTRQAARCFLAIAEYFHRLRALSSLWLARSRLD